MSEQTKIIQVQTSYKDWDQNTRLGQDNGPGEINRRIRALAWNRVAKCWEGTPSDVLRLARHLEAEAETLEDWCSGRQSVNARERSEHSKRLRRVAAACRTAVQAAGVTP